MEIGHCSVSETGLLEAHRLDRETECNKNPKRQARLHALYGDIQEGFTEGVTLELGLVGQLESNG